MLIFPYISVVDGFHNSPHLLTQQCSAIVKRIEIFIVVYSLFPFRELQLGGTVCIETKSKNGKRLMRRVRVVNKAEHLQPYLQRVCQVLGCCSELVSATRYPMGHCNQTSCVKGRERISYLSHAVSVLEKK